MDKIYIFLSESFWKFLELSWFCLQATLKFIEKYYQGDGFKYKTKVWNKLDLSIHI